MRESKRRRGGKRPPRGTGQPSEKDRATHVAARGKKNGKWKTLVQLTKKPLTDEEFVASLDAFRTESDRGVAILGAALVEDALLDAITHWLENPEDRDALYYDAGAPFGTFRNKAISAYALGICDKKIRDEMDIIRNVRNLFSHALRSIDFKNTDVIVLCDRLTERAKDPEIYALRQEQYGPSRMRFIGACLGVSMVLQKSVQKSAEAKLDFYRTITARAESGAEYVGDHIEPD